MREFIVLHVNGRRHEIRGPGVFAPLSTLLREGLGRTGTKVVCAEGDCGACAVLVGRPVDGRVVYAPLTSCIAMVHQLDGAHVITVEGLSADGALGPLQRSMVDHHGAQCGFCTAGFVVTLTGLFEQAQRPTDAEVRAALVGNLCRCTGYESILASARHADGAAMPRLEALYPPGPLLAEIAAQAEEEVLVEAGGRRFYRPVTLAGALAFKAEHPACTIVAGGTDLGVQVNKGTRTLDVVMSLAGVAELGGVEVHADHLLARGNATLSELEWATRDVHPEFHAMLLRHGSPLIRNAGTVAGNLANGSPIADALPGLFVLNAEVELSSVDSGGRGSARAAVAEGSDGQPPPGVPGEGVKRRWVNLNDFYTGYKRTVMSPAEVITAVRIPRLGPDEDLRLYKVSKRHDVDISTFTAAIWGSRQGNVLTDVRIAYGGCGPTVVRLPRAESLLRGREMSRALFDRAGRQARLEITPISDVRGRADYRTQLAENVLVKFYLDLSSREGAVPAPQET